MSSRDWEARMDAARLEREAADEAEATQYAAIRAADAERERRISAVEAEFIAVVERFRQILLDDGLREAKPARIKRAKKTMFRPQIFEIPLVIVEGAATDWWRAGESGGGPVSGYPKNLAIGKGIPAVIHGVWAFDPPIPFNNYSAATESRDKVMGARETFANHRHFGRSEDLVETLQNSLARWAVKYRPGLKL